MSNDSDGKSGGQAWKGGTNSEGANLFEVTGVSVQCEEIVANESRMACFGRVSI
jgi:hypothetical protein